MATPCRRKRSGAASQTDERSKKSKVRARAAIDWTASGESTSVGGDDRVDAAAALALGLVGEAQHGDDECDVALDGGDDLARVDALLADEAQHAVARLGERREALERLEGGGQASTVALVVDAAGVRGIGGRVSGAQGGGGTGGGHHAWGDPLYSGLCGARKAAQHTYRHGWTGI